VGGGDPHDAAWVASRVIGFSFGVPVPEGLALPGLAVLAGILALALLRMARHDDDQWIAFAVTLGLAPLAVMTLMRPEVVAVRYFLIGIAFGLLLLASLLADAIRSGAAGKAVSVALLVVFVVGNGIQTARFLELGRGGYREALARMAEGSPGDVIAVGSDHSFRTGLVLQHDARRLVPPRRVVLYRPGGPNPELPDGPQWWVVHRSANPDAVPSRLRDEAGRSYALAEVYPHAGISGFHWSLYRRSETPDASVRRSSTIPKP